MEIKKNVRRTRTVEEVEDIKCDICKKFCKNKITGNFEFMKLSAIWGFGSDHDLEEWNAHVCEKCVGAKLEPIVKFQKVSRT